MNKQKEIFLQQWEEKFPGVAPPDIDLTDSDTVTKELTKCKEVIKDLESQMNRAKFLLIFLQTCNAASKKSYERRRWGYGSSVESETDTSSPHEHHNDSDSVEEKKSPREHSNDLGKEAGNEPVVKTRPKHVTIREIEENKRISKVLENVKMFEGIKENDDTVSEGKHPLTGARSQSLRATSRKRAPYLEVWECKSGGDTGNKTEDSAGNRYSGEIGDTESFTAAAVSMMDPGSKKKLQKSLSVSSSHYLSQQSPSSRRDNYVEVWTCSTGDQVSLGVVYDDRMDFIESKYANNPFMVPDTEEYGLEDIDVKDGYGKDHYTLAGGEVKLRGNNACVSEQSSNRLTWPASKANAQEEFQDEQLGAGDSLPVLTASGSISEGTCDLSDIDHSSGDSSNCDSPTLDHAETESVTSGDQVLKVKSDIKSKTFPESASCGSPFHQLRQARTTNERINALDGAADGYYRGFEDDEDEFEWTGSTPDRGSLDSLEYSDDEYQGDETDLAPVTISESVDVIMSSRTDSPTFSYKPTGSKSSSKELRVPNLKKQQSSSKDDISITSSIPSQEDTETSPTHGRHSSTDTVTGMVDYHKVRNIAEAEKLRMRKWVVSSLLDSEETYLEYLNTLLLYMKPLKATISTSMPVMSNQDFETLFFRVPDLHSLHASFYEGLTPRLQDWNADTQIGDLFQNLLSKLNYYEDYVNNYKRAQHTAEKCAKENKQFATIIESLKVQSRKTKDSESISLIEILYKPVERVMRNTLVLQDLLKHTPHRHPDYHTLRQVLKHAQHFLNRINTSSSSSRGRKTPSSASQAAARRAQRVLVKDGYLVEVSTEGGSQRKLRHVFLYSDLLLCAKQKSAAGMFHSKESYECKWYIPLADLSFKPTEDSEGGIDVPVTSEDDLRDLSNRALGFKREIAREKKRLASRKGQETAIPASSRQLERFRKKLAEVEAQIVLSAPNLSLRIYHMQGKEKIKGPGALQEVINLIMCYMFLMSSDYERAEWTEAIIKQQESCFKSFSLTSLEVQSLLTSCVKLRKVSNVGSMLIKDDEDLLSGYLTVTIHSGKGFLHACNPYCTLEVDSYGHFQTKAKTRLCENTQNPEWNSEFELEVDGTQTLRILCYDRARGVSASYDDDVLIAKGKVGLVQESLRCHEWVNEIVLMNELEIKISVKFTPREQSLRRLPSHKSNGVFGVGIGAVCKREHGSVPSIVKMCVQEIEKRGMDEIGIYRVSGVASEVQELKAYFDANRKDVSLLLSTVDINAVAGVLKLYFRELPEPLFTNSKYSDFVDAVSLADPETKNNTMTRLLADLPSFNYHTLVYLREHLLKVQENDAVNKMTLHNLATVFGPTLLRPAEDSKVNTKGSDMMMLSALRMDVHYQMGVLLYCLELSKMPELGASTTGSKLMAKAAGSDNLLSVTTVPKSVSGSSPVAKPHRVPNNVYVDPTGKSSSAKQVSFASGSVGKSKQGEGNSDNPSRPVKPAKKSALQASQLRERYHAYEVVDIVPMSKSPTSTSPPQQLPAVNAQNASNNNNSVQINKRISQAYGTRGVAALPPKVPSKASKPVPAPRKTWVKKPQNTTVVTDL